MGGPQKAVCKSATEQTALLKKTAVKGTGRSGDDHSRIWDKNECRGSEVEK